MTGLRRALATLVVLGVLSGTAWAASGRLIFRVSDDPGTDFRPSAKVVALTFDDGPHPTWTPDILDILDRHRATGTFFVIGSQVRRYPKLAAGIVGRGNVVAGHTMDHVDLRG